jgi:hypothetical protein
LKCFLLTFVHYVQIDYCMVMKIQTWHSYIKKWYISFFSIWFFVVTSTKTIKYVSFLNQNKNTNKPSSKFRLQNKKNKNKSITCAKQKSNKILLQKQNKNKTRLWHENIPKINVEQTKTNVGFYFYLYPLGT